MHANDAADVREEGQGLRFAVAGVEHNELDRRAGSTKGVLKGLCRDELGQAIGALEEESLVISTRWRAVSPRRGCGSPRR